MSTTTIAAPTLDHLARMTTALGLHEHALHDVPRTEHGYCTDDVSRALVVVLREPAPTTETARLAEIYLGFLESAVAADGGVHNRRNPAGDWTDAATIGDWWGRALGALGFAASHAPDPLHRERAARAFLRAASRRSSDTRASAFAALGAAELLRLRPRSAAARSLLIDSIAAIPTAAHSQWVWPEARLRYANATLCEALIAGGEALGRRELVDCGLELLAFLLETETSPAGWLSPTGSGGSGPDDPRPQWDQQSIEPAAMADACARAYDVTGAPSWRDGVGLAWRWFLGENDSGMPMIDLDSGAGYDGLEPTGRNDNRGAESTLAALGVYQRAAALGVAGIA